jgi:DNA-binding NtrC family response regulator
MKKLLLAAGLAGVALAMGGDALACGDKLVIVGRGMRPKRAKGSVPASILVFADPKGSMPAALDEGHLRQDLEKAGHRVRSVGSREELDSALGTGSYDLVFTDIKSAPAVETEARGATSKPTVLPTLFNPSDADLAAATKEYHCVVKAPGSQKDYLAVVNEAMALRAKQQEADKKKQ